MCCRDRPGIKSHFVDTDCHLLRRGGWSGGAGGMKAREWNLWMRVARLEMAGKDASPGRPFPSFAFKAWRQPHLCHFHIFNIFHILAPLLLHHFDVSFRRSEPPAWSMITGSMHKSVSVCTRGRGAARGPPSRRNSLLSKWSAFGIWVIEAHAKQQGRMAMRHEGAASVVTPYRYKNAFTTCQFW